MGRRQKAVGRVGAGLAALAVFGALVHGGASASSAAGGPGTWWKADLHVHSVFSADAFPDLGIIAQSARAQGFNAIFLTDHNLGTNFPISSLTANHMTLTDVLDPATNYFRRWTPATDGTLSATTNQVSTADHFVGTNSLFLSSSSASGGETFAWTKRGPNFRSETGTTSISFSVKATRIDSGSSVYVSASIGGDPTVDSTPAGYTTAADGISHPGKSTVFIWYLGAPPPTTLFPGASVHETSLGSPVLNTWKSYSINVSDAVATLPAAEQPLDYDALSDLKIATSANAGTVSAFFDGYAVDAPTATSLGGTLAADEFIYRNGIIDAGTYDTSTFKLLPALEAGVNQHANRFDFDIKAPADYVSYQNGIDSIPTTQATGYPAQLNHPGVSGGVSDAQATSSNAEGADVMEVRQQNMINDWDAILRQTHPLTLIGTWGGDNHVGSWSAGSQSTFIYAPALTLDSLLHALYEGRAYLGPSSFSAGQMAFNLDGSTTPYPARYPVYVGQNATTENVHLGIAGGLSSGDVVKWLSNDGSTTTTSTLASDPTSGASYSTNKAVPIGGTSTYVRAEVRSSSNGVKGLTQPIVFEPVSGLPADKSIHVDSVTPTSGCQCSLQQTKGITAVTWNGTSSALSLSLVNPASSTVELLGKSATAPTAVSVDGAVGESTSLAAFQSATGDAWFYDASSQSLYIQDVQSATTSSIVVSFGSAGGDLTPPSVPTGVNGSPVGSTEIDLTWNASTDDVGGSGVAGYNVFRNGAKANTSLITSTSFNDVNLQASTQYSYTVSAVDNQGNESAQSSPPKVVTTGAGGGGGGGTFTPSADSYVDSSAPSTNYGSNVKLRVDTSPSVNSYLRFDVIGLSGPATTVTLKIYATSALAAGFEVHALANDSWVESTITSANAPAAGALLVSSGAATANSYVTITLPPSAVSGNGDVNFVLVGRSTTALALSSRESTNRPQLVVTSGGGGGGDTTPPSVPTNVNGSPVGSTEIDLSWTGSTDNSGGSGVAGYNVFRNGTKVNSSLVTTTNYADTGLSASTQYSYTVSAVDNATNESAQSSPPKQVTTGSGGGGGGGGTFNPVADSYVDASVPSTNFGSNVKLRVDTSPIVNSYLRFNVTGLSGSATTVTLKIYATSALAAGFEVHALADDSWGESTITSANAPAAGSLLATSPAAVANSYVTVNLPASAVSGNGDVNFVLVGRSTTALALSSGESGNKPQLVVT